MCPCLQFPQTTCVVQKSFSMVALNYDQHYAVAKPMKKSSPSKLIRSPVGVCFHTNSYKVKDCWPWVSTRRWRTLYRGVELQISKTNAHHRTIVLFQYLVPVTLVTILSLHSGYLIWTKTIPGEKDHCRDKMVAKSKKMVGVCLFFVFYCFIWLVFIYFYIRVVVF